MQIPSIKRRLACLLYETLSIAAVLFVASFVVVGLLPDVSAGWPRLLFQGYLFLVAGVYFTWFWRRGQTLAMKTWRIRLVDAAGSRPSLARVWARYGLAVLGLCLFGVGFIWAFWDAERQFLHDRLAGTRLTSA